MDIPERRKCLESLLNVGSYEISQEDDQSVRNLVDRYADVEQNFPEELKGTALPYFIDWLLEKVILVEIMAESDDDAYTIFESMNDRGKQLSPTDMLKGYLISQIDVSERSRVNEVWKKKILSLIKLGKEEESDFIKHWLRAKYARGIRKKEKGAPKEDFDIIGTTFHSWVKGNRESIGLNRPTDFYDFAHTLFSHFADEYLRIRKAAQAFDDELGVVFYNADNNFTLQYPVLLAPIRQKDDLETRNRKIRLVATYLDIMIARRAINYQTLNYSSMAYNMFLLIKAIRDCSLLDLHNVLKQKLFELDSDFSGTKDGKRHGFKEFELNQWSKRYIKHILARITSFIETQCGEPNRFPEYVDKERKDPFEIEHVWSDHFEEHRDEINTLEDFRRIRNRVGGLLLLPKSFNASFNDSTYEEKYEPYFGRNLLAKTLNHKCYDMNPKFNRFKEESGLKFRFHKEFKKADLLERQKLYKALCEQIWDPARLDREANA
ncbi:MAG: DUF262 domain-containing protein [Candidatus Stahlbacteria bacterium]|nr:MAG: DUF262 domain-containing protein [Candidatus Stahlbacteria bacterium]